VDSVIKLAADPMILLLRCPVPLLTMGRVRD
jgi:hypothetical protein